MRKYELMAIYDVEEKPLDETKTFVKDLFTANNVTVIDEKDMGLRELAYLINKKKKGYYYLFHFETEQNNLNEIYKAFKLNKGIMRYLTLVQD